MDERKLLLDLTKQELTEQLAAWGEPRYRADQIWQWVFQRGATQFAQMTNLPLRLRAHLEETFVIHPLHEVQAITSRDRLTRKALFTLRDGQIIETVLMLYDRRRTLCISTQVGCGMGCPFCATGLSGLARNLTAGEIVAQVLHFARFLNDPKADGPSAIAVERPTRLTHVVVMGMGEPLANYKATWQALRHLTDPDGFGLGARHITLSTVGLVPMIERMAHEPLQIGLAVSLHAPNDALRDQLVPINRRYPLSELMAACRRYVEQTRRRITFEYALMAGVNDRPEHARELARLLKGLLCHVNLIPLNPVQGSPYQPSPKKDAQAFQRILEQQGIPTTMRLRRGIEIDAGCGQLRRRALEPRGNTTIPLPTGSAAGQGGRR
ncbi:MAG: 23S rRNA (adenine(2503)-C(2))-methyltransferase RlmN [Anaerolineae bacterium]|nr:23S rRNA (adenine(2503)-C(2))-methyltransferase RlmN [Anaerolineae bacterium]MDW8101071.1 23S rRNA (adenine(2503)-C(2))-methyltransferase RlmN [Anaerolineae bacterium]